MTISVLIVSFRTLDDVKQCLRALEASTYADFEVVICENGGEDAWAEMAAALPERLPGGQRIQLLPPLDNPGFAGGVNACLRHASPAEAYWVLNPDTLPEPEALAHMVERLGRGDVGMVGHDLVLTSGKLASRGGLWRSLAALAVSIDSGKPRTRAADPQAVEARVNYVVGASMLVGAGYVDRVGLMREDYFLYCEEVEWCLRGQAMGERLGYAPDAVVLHRHGTSTGAGGPIRGRSKLSVYLQERNRLLLTRDLHPLRLPLTALIALAHLTIRYGKAGALRQLAFALQGWTAGLTNERHKPKWLTQRGAGRSPRPSQVLSGAQE